MGRLVVVNFTSMDGVVQAPLSADEDRDGGFAYGGWVPPYGDDVVDGFMRDVTVGAAGLLLGRRTYEIMFAAWARADDSEPAVDAMNRMPKHVVTSSSDQLEWANSHPVAGELGSAVEGIKHGVDGDLVVLGSATLARTMAELDAVDEYRLLVFPVVLGAGKRMFGEGSRRARFELTDMTLSSSGVAIHTYTRDRRA